MTTGWGAARRSRAALVLALSSLTAVAVACTTGARTAVGASPLSAESPNDPFLDTVQVRTFRWFWNNTDGRTGLTPDRWPTRSFSSVAAIGFGLSAYVVGAERRYVTRAAAAERTLNTLRFLYTQPQDSASSGVAGYRGFFYHFLDFDRGLRFEHVELSTIDTALLLAGALSCQQYFDRRDATEAAIRAYADSVYRRVDWRWARARPPAVSMGWHPERGFIPSDWIGYNEAMVLYVLALGSPTHPVEPEAWTAWTSRYHWAPFYGREHVNFAPLFGHQYSHIWIDFRGIQDAYMRGRAGPSASGRPGMDYFENSRRATLSQQAYAVHNPNGWRGYGANLWGLTAVDGPKDTTLVWEGRQRQFFTYRARGAAANEIVDDGTLAPTAVGGSVPFAPEITIPTLKHMRHTYGSDLFTEHGFLDSFNPTYEFGGRVQHGRMVPGRGWFDGDYLGIDQGPILLMIENYRTGLLWDLMKKNPYFVRGLCRAGFAGGWLSGKCQ
jgi:hypothetical protein